MIRMFTKQCTIREHLLRYGICGTALEDSKRTNSCFSESEQSVQGTVNRELDLSLQGRRHS